MNYTDLFGLFPQILPYLKVIFILVVAFFAIRLIRKYLVKFLSSTILPTDSQNLLQRVVVYVLWFAVLMYITKELKLEEIFLPLIGASILAGAAIALAVKDILSDAVAGIFLLLDRHFNIGSDIETMNHRGEIFDVTLRKTRIKTNDGTIVILPNGRIDSSGWVLHGKKTKEEE